MFLLLLNLSIDCGFNANGQVSDSFYMHNVYGKIGIG